MSIVISPDAVDQSVVLRALDSTTFLPYTSIAYNTAGIDLWYRREGAAKVSITEATLAALTTAHADGGVIHIGDGYFRLDLPDAAVATGVDRVAVGGTATGVVIIGQVIMLNFVTPAGIQSEVDDALVGRGLHKLVSSAVTGTDVANDSIVAKLVSGSATADWDDFVNTTDALQPIRDKLTDIETDTAEIGAAGAGLTAILTTQMTESYAADGTAPTLAQAIFLIQQSIGDFSISGTTITVKKIDGSTTAAQYTLDSATLPTSRTRSV